MSRKLGGCAPFWGEAGSPSKKIVSWADAYLRTKWHLDPFSLLATRHGPKIGGLRPFLGELGPHLTQSRLDAGCPAFVPGGILIDPAVWPQHTWAEYCGRL